MRHLLPPAGEGNGLPALQRRYANAVAAPGQRLPSPARRGRCPKGGWGQQSGDVPAGRSHTAPPPSSGAVRHLLPTAGEGNGLPALQRRCANAAAAPSQRLPSPRPQGKVPEGRMGGSSLATLPQARLARHQRPSSGAARHLLPPAGEGNGLPALQRRCANAAAPSQRLPSPARGGRCPKGGWGAAGAAAAHATLLIERQKSSTAVLAHRMH